METKLYNEEDHLNKTSDEIKQLYATIKEQILALGDIDLKINKQSIAFRGCILCRLIHVEIYAFSIEVEES